MADLTVHLLGPVDVVTDGVPRAISGLRRKALLATLALRAREIVGVDRLIEVVWNGRAPATAKNTLQANVSYLRRILESKEAIVARAPGYLLNVRPEAIDVMMVERLVQRARDSTDMAGKAAHLRMALGLWRGRPLTDVGGLDWLDEQAARLTELRLTVVLGLIDARLALGEHEQLVPELERLAEHHPFREQIHAQLMLALYRCGRQSDALSACRRLRRCLGDELGVDPSPAVRELEIAILRQDDTLTAPLPGPATPLVVRADGSAVRPGQLPRAVRSFVGRSWELGRLDEILAGMDGGDAGDPTSVLIVGPGGVGKTSLAVHWAHRVAPSFPDGHLHADLRGFDTDGAATRPSDVLERFLTALGVPPERAPAEAEAQASLYRSLVAGRRLLILLDNARDAEQVRPLLPGSADCLILITSRHRMTSLVATDAAVHIRLDPLPAADAHDLLVGRIGADRSAAEPEVVEQILEHCHRLPLALTIAAARAVTEPDRPLARLAADLRDPTNRLDTLQGGDRTTDVRFVFHCSYRALSPGTARTFRLLGLHPGPDISSYAAASLAGLSLTQMRHDLAELDDAHLIREHRTERFTFHDLLRTYAAEQVRRIDSHENRQAAHQRLLDHYLHTAHTASALINAQREPIPLDPPATGVSLQVPRTAEAAQAWFEAEDLVLFDLVQRLPTDLDAHRWKLTWSIMPYVYWRGRWPDPVLLDQARAAAQRLDDPVGQAQMERCLGIAASRQARHEDAAAYFSKALQHFVDLDDTIARGRCHLDLACALDCLGRLKEARWHAEQGLDLYRRADHRVGQARALNCIGWNHLRHGEHQQAAELFSHVLTARRELGDTHGEAITRDRIGTAHHRAGRYREAVDEYQQALEIFCGIGDRYNEAETLTRLGDTYHVEGHQATARLTWIRALTILEDLAHPTTADLRVRLDPPSDRSTRIAIGNRT